MPCASRTITTTANLIILCVKVFVQDTEYALYYQIEFISSTEMHGGERTATPVVLGFQHVSDGYRPVVAMREYVQFYSLDRDGDRVNVQVSFYLYCIIVTHNICRWNRLHDQEAAQKTSLKRKRSE